MWGAGVRAEHIKSKTLWVALVQAPENILTVLRALKLPSGPHAGAVFNALLDHGHVEKLALVEVLCVP